MKKMFIVAPGDASLSDKHMEGAWRIVEADTRAGALDKYWADFGPSRDDVEYCQSMSTNTSMLSHFLYDDRGSMYDDFTGNYRADILERFEDDKYGLDAHVADWVSIRVREFFKGRQTFAEAYMTRYWRGRKAARFPKEMIVYMLRESQYLDVVAVAPKVLR